MKKFFGVVVTFICLIVLTVPSWAGPGSDGDGGPAPWCPPNSQCCDSMRNPGTSEKPCCYLCVRPRTFGDINAPLTQFEYRSLMSAPVPSATKGHDLDCLANQDHQVREATQTR
jgi:hypothetical protein